VPAAARTASAATIARALRRRPAGAPVL
jgi:hypothetical protein